MGNQKVQKKKGNAGVGIDFKRVKHKVGKKLPKAQNETDTTIRARSIHLPTQSLAVDVTPGTALSSRHLSLREVLSQSSHYAEKTRRDAMTQLTELLTKYPTELTNNLSLVMERLAERVTDSDANVRSSSLALLRTTVLSRLDPTVLRPFLPLWMAHIQRGMTHLAHDIRSDALSFLDALLARDAAFALGASGWLASCLEHYCILMRQRHATGGVGQRSVGALDRVLEGLERFLRHAKGVWGEEEEGEGQGQGRSSGNHQHGLIFASRAHRAAFVTPSSSTSSSSSSSSASLLLLQLVMLLLDAWQECAPCLLDPQLDRTALSALRRTAACLECTLLLLANHGVTDLSRAFVPVSPPSGDGGGGFSNKKNNPTTTKHHHHHHHSSSTPPPMTLAEAVTKKIALFFPLGVPAVKPTKEDAESLISANLHLVRILLACLPPPPPRLSSLPQPPYSHHAPSPPCPAWILSLARHLVGILARNQVLAIRETLSESSRESPAPLSAIQAAFSGIIPLLFSLPLLEREALLDAVWMRMSKSSPKSVERAMGWSLLSKLIGDPVRFCGSGVVAEERLCTWLEAAPKTLWEVGTGGGGGGGGGEEGGKRVGLAMLLLRALHDATRMAPRGSRVEQALSGMQSSLAALWAAVLPSGGHDASTSSSLPRIHLGPLLRLPLSCQLMAADIMHLSSSPPQFMLLRAAAIAALSSDGRIAIRLVHAVSAHAESLPPTLLLSFYTSMLTGRVIMEELHHVATNDGNQSVTTSAFLIERLAPPPFAPTSSATMMKEEAALCAALQAYRESHCSLVSATLRAMLRQVPGIEEALRLVLPGLMEATGMEGEGEEGTSLDASYQERMKWAQETREQWLGKKRNKTSGADKSDPVWIVAIGRDVARWGLLWTLRLVLVPPPAMRLLDSALQQQPPSTPLASVLTPTVARVVARCIVSEWIWNASALTSITSSTLSPLPRPLNGIVTDAILSLLSSSHGSLFLPAVAEVVASLLTPASISVAMQSALIACLDALVHAWPRLLTCGAHRVDSCRERLEALLVACRGAVDRNLIGDETQREALVSKCSRLDALLHIQSS